MNTTSKSDLQVTAGGIGPHDIVFECPSCGKSLVVEDKAEGLVVPCPRCSASVIVPPREKALPVAKPAVKPVPVTVPVRPAAPVLSGSVPDRLAGLLHQLKEMQTQRTEIGNRVATHLNEVTRDLVALSRLDATQQELVTQWAQVVASLEAQMRGAVSSPPKAPAPPGSSPRAT
jgi:DNA-directed RNA polymerase subunit RPC12/RpoP